MKFKPGRNIPTNMRMLAIATSVVLELMAGPFMGYFLGYFLVHHMKFPFWAIPIAVFLGFILGFYVAISTINKINQVHDQSDA